MTAANKRNRCTSAQKNEEKKEISSSLPPAAQSL